MSDARTHWVYEAFDADGISLYVGCTKNFERRYREHMSGNGSGRGWFEHFVTNWTVSGPYAPAVARRIERERIEERQPIYNGLSRENRQNGDRGLIAQYLAYHGVRYQQHPWRNRPDLVPVSRGPRRRAS